MGLRIRLWSLYTKGINHPSRNKKCRVWLHLMVEPVFWVITGSLVVVPLLWIFIRKKNSTDHEGREPPVLSKSLTEDTDPSSTLPLYGPGMDYTAREIGKEWEHPDITFWRRKMKSEEEAYSKKKSDSTK